MKIYKHLFEKICTYQNFWNAYLNATSGKQHYREVIEINKHPEEYIRNLLEEVKTKKYRVSQYTIFKRFTGGKMREIYKLPMKDRIVQHAIMIYLEPIFRETFIPETYSSIKYRGIHLGIKRIKKEIKDNNLKYYLKLDIKKCYPSVDLSILKLKLFRKFQDKDLLDLISVIINSCEHGLPIGNYTSLYFNNFYFNDLDHWIKEVKGCKFYHRYCDDMIIMSNDKLFLHTLFLEISSKITELNVSLKPNYLIYNIEKLGINFLGYIIYKDYIKLRKHTKLTFIHKISLMDPSKLTKRDLNVVGSYYGVLKHANCRNLLKKYMNNFKDLNIDIYKRLSISDVEDKEIIVEWIKLTRDNLKMQILYKDQHFIVNTNCECLVDAFKELDSEDYPFTTIIRKVNNYYMFT